MYSADTKMYEMIFCAILFRFLLLTTDYETNLKKNHETNLGYCFENHKLFVILTLSHLLYGIIFYHNISLNIFIPIYFNMLTEHSNSTLITFSNYYISITVFFIEKSLAYSIKKNHMYILYKIILAVILKIYYILVLLWNIFYLIISIILFIRKYFYLLIEYPILTRFYLLIIVFNLQNLTKCKCNNIFRLQLNE